MLPPALLAHAGLGEHAAFAGRGATFQIWEPEAYEAYESEAIRRASEEAPRFELMRGPGGEGEGA
jgi:MraZ protein